MDTQKEKLNTQLNAEETHKENSSSDNQQLNTLIERHEIKGTPFWAMRAPKGWFLALGDRRITEFKNSKKEAENELKSKMWDIIAMLVIRISETIKTGEIYTPAKKTPYTESKTIIDRQ